MMDKILEFCGLHRNEPTGGFWWDNEGNLVIDRHQNQELDMNFFFQYVRPKLLSVSMSWSNGARCLWILELTVDNRAEGFSDDPNKAWQEALGKLLEER